MHLASGLAWALPVCLAVEAAPGRRPRRARRRGGPPTGGARGRRGLRVRQGARGRELLPHDRRGPSRTSRGSTGSTRCTWPARSPSSTGPSRPSQSSRIDPAETRAAFDGARLAARRRLPDPQPDPPRARVPDESRARDGRRPAHPPARRRDEVRRRARPRPGSSATACSLDNYYPAGPRRRLRLPGGDALRGPARGDLARDLPQELRLLALHRRSRPRRCRRLLRHVRRSADLRRVRAARARTSSRCSSSTPSGARPAARWRRRRRARTAATTTCSCPGRRSRELLEAGELPPVEFSRPEVAEVLIDAYK